MTDSSDKPAISTRHGPAKTNVFLKQETSTRHPDDECAALIYHHGSKESRETKRRFGRLRSPPSSLLGKLALPVRPLHLLLPPPSATSVEDARLEGEEEEMDSSQPAELQDQVVEPEVVIRGLPSNTEPEDIKSEIEAEGFKVAKISQMKNYRSKAPMPLFYLQIENGAKALKIYDFTELFGTRIEVKPFERGNKAEVIADSLQEQFEPNHVADREIFDQRIHEEVTNFLATPHVQEIEPTTPTEVLTYVQRIKPKKSPGLDQISNHSWKTAVVIPILKPDKNPDLAQNYRPISLLSCLSKVYEFVLLQRLNQHYAAVNFIIPQQCGFRPKCSTVHQLLRVTELIHSGFAKHEATGILFLDIAKAFDKIWHDGLLIKLIRLDFPAPLIKSIHSFPIDHSE
ncbi:probable RNA-directed DNA polymerase from transposon X-element [Trichonephila clavipes]|nr:probable RNA-directed DNA polymerase from transposon X-element [Trichonephila clavipes]